MGASSTGPAKGSKKQVMTPSRPICIAILGMLLLPACEAKDPTVKATPVKARPLGRPVVSCLPIILVAR